MPWAKRLETRKEIIGDCTLYHGDAAEILSIIDSVDALVTDPPYGIREAAGKNASRSKPFGGHELKMPGKTIIARDYGNSKWDNGTIALELMDMARSKARWQIIFGGNYYVLPPTRCWLVWDKLNGASHFADCELAWTNLNKAVRRLCYLWNGMLRANKEPRGDHPTQKPVGVMRWCIEHLPADANTILDPFMGSGTTGVAAVQLGRKFIGIEREEKYFDAACRRITEAYQQGDLVAEAAKPKEKQLTLA